MAGLMVRGGDAILRAMRTWIAAASAVLLATTFLAAQRGGAASQFPGGLNPDGSLRPAAPVSRYFTQDAYTEYAILEPGSESFRIRYIFESTNAGATEMVNATRGGSEGSGVEVYDPRTGQPLKFVYEQSPRDPETHQIRATLTQPIPAGGIGRLLIYKTYKDPRTYMMNGKDVVWVRSLAGYRLGVILPKGFAFISSDVAAQLSTTADGRLKLAFANPSGQSNPVTIRARPTTAAFTPSTFDDMFFDDIKTLYDLDAPETGQIAVEQIYSDYRKGPRARLDSLSYLQLRDAKVTDLDTARELPVVADKGATFARLEVPITDDRQSAHLKITGTLKSPGYTLVGNELVFQRTLKGLRNTVVLPKDWEVSGVSQSATLGTDRSGRTFVSLINLNAENNYKVTIRAKKSS
jgi:hypothetical protein